MALLTSRWRKWLPLLVLFVLAFQLHSGFDPRKKLISLWYKEKSCPSLSHPPTIPRISSGSGSGYTCNSTASLLSEFTVDICYNDIQCSSIELVIKRTNASACSEMEGKPGVLLDDPKMDNWMRNEVGPDAFMALTDGAERKVVWLPAEYRQGCEYIFPVRASNGGPLSVQLYWHYDVRS